MTTADKRGRRPVDLLEEATFLLRGAPLSAWLCYCAGVMPFVLGLLYFWADMSRDPSAPQHASVAALGLAFLFIWMKCGQALFAATLKAHLVGLPRPRWTLPALGGLALRQAIWQPTSLLLLPLALLVTLPFGWCYAFYQNLTVLEQPGGGQEVSLKSRSIQMTKLWPKQNHLLLLLLSVLAIVLFLSIFSLLAYGPTLLRTFTGIETPFSRSLYSFWNSTFLMVCMSLCFLLMDPLVKSVYLLRCFYGESIQDGMDLRVRLRLTPLCLGLGLLAFSSMICSPGQAAEPSLSVEEIESSLDEVMSKPEYRWRRPRDSAMDAASGPTWLERFTNWLEKKVDGWFEENRSEREKEGESHALLPDNWVDILVIGSAVILGVIGIILYARHLISRRAAPTDVAATVDPSAALDLSGEEVSADQLPADGWLGLVDELMAKGQYRLALRACFLAQLAHLANLGLIRLAQFKTNRDYESELATRRHVQPTLCQEFEVTRRLFDRVWYGNRPAEQGHVERLLLAIRDKGEVSP